eukprot:g66012.t1
MCSWGKQKASCPRKVSLWEKCRWPTHITLVPDRALDIVFEHLMLHKRRSPGPLKSASEPQKIPQFIFFILY